MTPRMATALIALSAGLVFGVVGWVLATDFRRLNTRHASRTVRLFAGYEDDLRIERQRRFGTFVGWLFMLGGGVETVAGLGIAIVGFHQ